MKKELRPLFFAVLLLAAVLRFWHLGAWSFAGDETATLVEERVLFAGADAPSDSQTYRLPRAVPLSYLVHHLGYSLFGRDEFGSRVMMALLGTAQVGIFFWMLTRLTDMPTAVAIALLLALWPEHVFQSQQNRFYVTASLFAGVSLLAGAMLARRPSVGATVVTCIAIALTVLCHSLIGLAVYAIVVVSVVCIRPRLDRQFLVGFGVTGLLIALFFVFYLWPILRGWNQGGDWGYSVARSVLALVNMVGWPVALLAAMGALLLLGRGRTLGWYWLIATAGVVVASVVFPRLVAFHPGYVFPLALPVFVLAGGAIGTIFRRLRAENSAVAYAWVGVAVLLGFPSLASHYLDGSRPDFRAAAGYLCDRLQPGDRVYARSPGLVNWYCPDARALPLGADPVATLAGAVEEPGRVWVVVQSGRDGIPPELRRWLGEHFSHVERFRKTRLDYYDFTLDVFLRRP